MKENLLMTVMYNCKGEIEKEYFESNNLVALNDEDTINYLIENVKNNIRKEYNKRIEFENLLKDNENIKSFKNEGNSYYIELNNIIDIFDIFKNYDIEELSIQLTNGKTFEKVYEIENSFIFKVQKTYRDDNIILSLLSNLSILNYGMTGSNFNEIKNLNIKKYKGINYHKINNDYSGTFYKIEIENDNVFTPTLNKLIRENLKHNNISLKTEKDCKEYINLIIEDVKFINNINIDFISYKIEKKLNEFDGNFESIIKESFKSGLITGIKDIEIINKEYPVEYKGCIDATIFIKNDSRKIRYIKYVSGEKNIIVY